MSIEEGSVSDEVVLQVDESDKEAIVEEAPSDGEAEGALAECGEVEEEGEEATGTAGGASGEVVSGVYNANDVNDQVFEELRLEEYVADQVLGAWNAFLKTAESREAAGEAIYAALFDAAPSLQSLFKTPRAVMAMRFMNGVNQILNQLHDPKALKVIVETLGFQHLDLEVTEPRVVIFRDAIVELIQGEIGAVFTNKAKIGLKTALNYVGGAYIYVRVKYAERLRCLGASWAQANSRTADLAEIAVDGEGEEGGAEASEGAAAAEAAAEAAASAAAKGGASSKIDSKKKGVSSRFGAKSVMISGGKVDGSGDDSGFHNTNVPKNFQDMFMFNAAVMGFGGSTWMQEILFSFDTIVINVSNSYRLQEECDVLGLRMAKYKGTINLGEFKSVMLASLRSLVKDWGSLHEVSWSWLWDNMERLLKSLTGKPAKQEAALEAFLKSLDESSLMIVRREVYAKFFALAPAGQDFFKQSTTRLHFIADKLVTMTMEMYREPKRMVEDISALGLRHVGYGIPTDLFGPFVTACVQVVRMLADDDEAEEAFRWSLSLISRILTRVINEGSTIVMKAINANSGKQLKKAVACAPRGKRALWMLNVQVGTQSISPLMWAIETGSLDAANAIIIDLLTIRADRDRYYYGMDIMFERHPDVIKRLCLDAPALLPVLLDGLIWRSRVTENGRRRVNYYLKHFVQNADGNFSPAIEWITDHGDPKVVCHPIVSMVTDMVWVRVAFKTFLIGKAWFFFTLVVFILSQSILNHLNAHTAEETDSSDAAHDGGHRRLASAAGVDSNSVPPKNSFEVRVAIFVCRCFIYFCSMGQWMFYHTKLSLRDVRKKVFIRAGCINIPGYLSNWQDTAGLFLMLFLMLMLCFEPILHCMSHADAEHIFTEHCMEGEALLFPYSIMSTATMLLYFLLLSDLSVFSTRVSAFVLVITRVLSEVLLFLFGLSFFAMAFACAISSLEQDDPDFAGIPKSALNLLRMTFGMFSGGHYDILMDYPALMVAVFIYVVTTIVFLSNLLIAQLNCAYQSTYLDMLGFARLNRGKIVYETMPAVSVRRWSRFVDSLRLDERVEFGEGDIGLAGGMQVLEPASLNITTVDMIRRFGGSTSPAAQWPDENLNGDDQADRFERMEKLIEKTMKRVTAREGRKGSTAGGGSSSGVGSSFLPDASSASSD